MSKSFGKFLLCSALVAGAAYGAYSYLQKKDIITHPEAGDDTDDDFDDFSEDLIRAQPQGDNPRRIGEEPQPRRRRPREAHEEVE